jgi:CubicO group peptidase (beta-lactamase class C family)
VTVGSTEADDAIAATLAATTRAQGIPALAGAVVTAATIRSAVTGVRRRGRAEPATPEYHFHIGSNAKALTATVAALLVEAGRLDWGTRPADVIPELAGHVHAAYDVVTLDMLLTHRAGVPAFTSGWAVASSSGSSSAACAARMVW